MRLFMRIANSSTPVTRVQRPAELEDFLNRRIFHPASWRLASALASTPVTPNLVSIAGALVVMLAASIYSVAETPLAVLAGLAVHLSWHVLDGADGDLARLTHRSSARGELVDGVCDIAGHIVLYLVLGTLAASQIGVGWGWGLAVAAGVSRLLQAAHYEGSRRQYQQIVYGTPWLGDASNRAEQSARYPLADVYRSVVRLVVPQSRVLSAASQSPADACRLGTFLRAKARHIFTPMTPLSANYRTIAAGFAMLAGQPHWFFLFELMVLSAVLAFSILNSRRIICEVLAS
jgi:phosphatidylglycerophosphate synthase